MSLSWGSGDVFRSLFLVGDRLYRCTGRALSPSEALCLLKKFPELVPYIGSGEHYVLEDVVIGNERADLVVVEPRRKSRVVLYLFFFKWYSYGSGVEDFDSPAEVYSAIGFDLENIDEVVGRLRDLGLCRKKWARELKRRIKALLGVKRLIVDDVYAIIVVDKLTSRFIEIINGLNDLIDAYVDAISLTEYRLWNSTRLVASELYTWRTLDGF